MKAGEKIAPKNRYKCPWSPSLMISGRKVTILNNIKKFLRKHQNIHERDIRKEDECGITIDKTTSLREIEAITRASVLTLKLIQKYSQDHLQQFLEERAQWYAEDHKVSAS